MSNIQDFSYTANFLYDDNFDVYRSNVCHLLHNEGDKNFIRIVLQERIIDQFNDRNLMAHTLYMVAMLDYVSKENDVPLCTNYNFLRILKLKNLLMPASLYLIENMYGIDSEIFKDLYNQALPEFLKYNILESDVRNVV